ncbi:MAG: hypothetical protein HGB28_01090, partial [Oscillochloris sp.]|nr:hypothetical protein [Oscillochloris sp.]
MMYPARKRIKMLLFACLLPLLSTLAAPATASPDQPVGPHLVVERAIGGFMSDIAVFGTYALLVEGAAVNVIDLHDPAHPARVASLLMPTRSGKLAVAEKLAAVSLAKGKIQIIDITNPTAPRLRGHYILPAPYNRDYRISGGIADIALDGSLAYLLVGVASAGYAHGGLLLIVSLENPDQPTLIGEAGVSGLPNDLQVRAGIAYVGSTSDLRGTGGLEIFDVTNPRAPANISLVKGYGYDGESIEVADGIAYVGDTGIYDVHQLSAPREIAPLTARTLRVHRGRGYAIEPDGMLIRTLDLADPAKPRQIAETRFRAEDEPVLMPGRDQHSLRIVGDQLFVTSRDNLSIFRLVGNAGKLVLLGRLNGGLIDAVVSDGSLAYAGGDYIWLPTGSGHDLSLAEEFAGERTPQLLGVTGRYAYLASHGQLLVADLANPTAGPLGRLVLPADPDPPWWPTFLNKIALEDEMLYLYLPYSTSATPDAGQLVIIDGHDPHQPRIVSQIVREGMDDWSGVVFAAGFVYVRQTTRGATVFDVRNPAAPTIDAQPFWQGISVATLASDGRHLFVYETGSLTVIDIQNPARPTVLATISVEGWRLTAHGGRIYAGGSEALTVIAISNPAAPQIIARTPLP